MTPSGTPRWRTTMAPGHWYLPERMLPGAFQEWRGRQPYSEAAHLEMVMAKVRRRGTTLGNLTPHAALPILETNKTETLP